jgi:hypothetical protein
MSKSKVIHNLVKKNNEWIKEHKNCALLGKEKGGAVNG